MYPRDPDMPNWEIYKCLDTNVVHIYTIVVKIESLYVIVIAKVGVTDAMSALAASY
jgi:hypothetical protein